MPRMIVAVLSLVVHISAVHSAAKHVTDASPMDVARDENKTLLNRKDVIIYDKNHYLVEGDILLPRIANGTQGLALREGVYLWRTVRNGKYEIPYDPFFPTERFKRSIEWAFRYIEMGSNLKFRPVQPGDTSRIVFTTSKSCCCTDYPYGQQNVELNFNLGRDDCFWYGTAVHEVLHALGFLHEQSRPDRGRYVDERYIGSQNRNFLIDPGAKNYTLYDYASVMHYYLGKHNGATLVSLGPNSHLYVGNRMFLSSCDWYALNVVYPGDRLPPPCNPGELPDHLVPVVPNNPMMQQLCKINPNYYYYKQMCRFRNGKDFPDFDFIPIKSAQQDSDDEDETLEPTDTETEETSDDDSDEGNVDQKAEVTDQKAEVQKKPSSLRSYCLAFQADSGETLDGCLDTCLSCGDKWKHNLTKTNVRTCVDEYNEYCHAPDNTRRGIRSTSAAYLIPFVPLTALLLNAITAL